MGFEASQDLILVELVDWVKLEARDAKLRLERQLELACGVLSEQAEILKELAKRRRNPSSSKIAPMLILCAL